MESSDFPDGKASKVFQKSVDKFKIKIHNILPTLERTFLQIGSTIGKYRIIEEIDRGGMAVVYKALQLDLDREVALKVLPANITINRRFVERFLSEAHAVARLQHPNIVNIHEVAVENNVYYLAMDYISGMNLYYHLNFQKPKLVEVLEITAKLADALSYAHKRKIIHRDLKLNNIIMRDNVTPVLIDFGLAKALEGEDVALTKTGEIMGSPAYMAPERLAGSNTDARSDICSLGIMLYEMLTFKNPYLDPRSMPQTTMNVMEADPILPRKLVPWLPVEIEAITLKAMQKDPDNRYQTMEEFAADIRRYQKGEQVLANPPSLLSKAKHLLHVYWPIIAISLLIVVFSSLFALTFYYNNKKEQPYWQLAYHSENNKANQSNDWYWSASDGNKSAATWVVQNNALRSPEAGCSFIRLNRTFSYDARIEFDIKAGSENFSNMGFFLNGICPDSGYCFHLLKGPRAQNGISYPGSDFLFADYNPIEFIAGMRYHVCIEKKEKAITFKVNDLTIGKIWDFFPPAGKNHQHLGFFINGFPCEINNLKIYTYTLPRSSSKDMSADRFAQRGEFQLALDEYKELLPELSTEDAIQDILLKMCDCQIRLRSYDEARKLFEKMPLSEKHNPINDKRFFLEGILNTLQGRDSAADSFFVKLFRSSPLSPMNQSAQNLILLHIVKYLNGNDVLSAQQKMKILVEDFSVSSKTCGGEYLMIMEYYCANGYLDKAKDIGETIMQAFKNNPDVLLMRRVLMSRIFLAKGDKSMATDLLNQCIASYVPSEAAWQAWMELAEIYEYDANNTDAFTIYRKIFDDCPKYLIFPWMARVKMGEIANRVSSEEKPERIFDAIIAAPHPFALPRLIARYYKGVMTKEEFKNAWLSFYPNSKEYLKFYARKALINNKPEQAVVFLEEFKENLPPNTWASLQVNKALSLLQK
jgi:Serine/threonine protein kinase